MNLIKKLIAVGLSLLVTISPCFAQTINVNVGNRYWVMDSKIINKTIYVKANDLSNYFGFEYGYDRDTDQVIVILKDEYITLDMDTEVQLINDYIYVPLKVIEEFYGTISDIADYAHDTVDPTGGYTGEKGKISVSMFTSEEGGGAVELNLNGQNLRIEIKESFANRYVGYTANGVVYEFEFYQDDDTSNYKQFYNVNRATYVDVYCNEQFIDCLKRTEIYYGG